MFNSTQRQLFLICISFWVSGAFAQKKVAGTQLRVSMLHVPESKVKQSQESFGFNAFHISLSQRLFQNFSEKESFFKLSLAPRYQAQQFNLPYFNSIVLVHQVSLGLSGLLHPKGKNTWLFALHSGMNADAYSFGKVPLLFSGFAVFNRNSSEIFSYQLGAVYTFAFGRGIPLPFLGFKYKPSEKKTLQFRFPFHLVYKTQAQDWLEVSYALRQLGNTQFVQTNRYKYGIDSLNFDHPNQRLRQRQTLLSINFCFKIPNWQGLRLELEAGLALRKNLRFQSNSNTEASYAANIKTSTFIQLSAKIPIRKKKKEDNPLDGIDSKTISEALEDADF